MNRAGAANRADETGPGAVSPAGAASDGVVRVNGVPHRLPADAPGNLIGWLRGRLGLTGAKPGCGEGVCGACTVLVDGAPVLSCQVPLPDVIDTDVTTIEGLAPTAGADAGALHPVQAAILAEGAAQCGYCTPGMVLRAVALLAAEPEPDDDRIAEVMGPNLCRCGCYPRLRRAVRRAAAGGSPATGDRGAVAVPGGPPGVAPGDRGGDRPGDRAGVRTGPAPRPARPWDLCAPADRDYAAILGPGVVCVWPPPAPASGMWSTSGGAWVHVAPAGRSCPLSGSPVTAFSGKVDVGQDNGTAFRLLVAEELGVSAEDVVVVQGDTDLCPFDMGTFGSRSMPDAGEALRRAAAGARCLLQGLGPGGPPVDGCRVEVLDREPALTPPGRRRLVGRPGWAPDRLDAVNGQRRFVSDLERPGMGHGAVLRPPVPGAHLRSADTRRAAVAGVTVVEEGPFIGVVAADPATARSAVAAIDARWELPSPLDGDVVEWLRGHPVESGGWERAVDTVEGDVDAALEGASCTLSATYVTAYLAHVPLETRAAVAEWDSDRLTVWTGTQVPFGVRSQVAGALGLPEGSVRVIVPATGGAFGGKHAGEVSVEAARLASAAGRPVRVHWSRAEEMRWGTVRPMAVIDIRAGLDDAGRICGWDFLDVNAGAAALAGPYRTGASRLRSQPAQSPLRQGSYRALAANANTFARESAIDELAHAATADPVAFRLEHLDDERLAAVLEAAAARFGWADVAGSAVGGAVAGSVLSGVGRAAVSGVGGSAGPRPGGRGATRRERTGIGVAVGLEKGGRVATCATVHVDDDGRVRAGRMVTAYECGTVVNRDTVCNQIEGATVMALGGALFEEVRLEAGRLASAALADYRVPRFGDVPDIDVVLIDRPDLPSAGAGETPMIAVAPALANALYAATGRRFRRLPLAPDGRLPEAGAGT